MARIPIFNAHYILSWSMSKLQTNQSPWSIQGNSSHTWSYMFNYNVTSLDPSYSNRPSSIHI